MSISGATAAAAVANTATATVVSAAAATAAITAATAATATNVYTQFMPVPCCHHIQQDARTTFDRAIKIAYKYI